MHLPVAETSSNAEVVLVTGASRGIGRAIALALGTSRRAVVVNYRSRQDAAQEVVGAIQRQGGRATAVQGDVALAGDRARLVDETMAHFGRVDVLVNNAGIASPGRQDLLEATEESWDQVFGTNLKGPFFLTQRVAREMIRSKRPEAPHAGVIVNISSISSIAVSTNRADYCMAKAAMHSMTEHFAVRLAEHGIAVFEICPGVIASDMTAPVKDRYDRLIAEGLSPIRRWGTPEDVARAVVAVAEGSLPFCTGQSLFVDGGMHIRRL